MRSLYFSFISLLSVSLLSTVTAQQVVNAINLHSSNFPQERIHIHFDRESYLPGETIWFKAYIMEENLPGVRSTNFYAALYDDQGRLIEQQLCPVFSASAVGHFDLPANYSGQQVICRASTAWMQQMDSTSLYTRTLPIINTKASTNSQTSTNKQVSLQFFPEGGDLVEGTTNTIAFKANYNNGLPFNVSGSLKLQQTGEVLAPVASIHDGMGRFDLQINSGEKYYVEWADDKGNLQRTYLPAAKSAGVVLKLAQVKDKLIFNITNSLPADSLHVLMYMYQKVFYQANIAVSNGNAYTQTISTATLPAGTMQLTVFDNIWQPVAERIAFIGNAVQLNTVLNTSTINLSKRGKNVLEIVMPDTMPANLSLSVTDAALNSEPATQTILTDLLLRSSLRGYVNDPAYYFGTAPEAKAQLDLVMMTHGWRKYNWVNVVAGKMPQLTTPTENYLSLYGNVPKNSINKLGSDEVVNLIIKTKDSSQNFYQLKPDANGYYKMDGLVFYDTARVLYSFKKNKSFNSQLAFSNNNQTLTQPVLLKQFESFLLPDTIGTKPGNGTELLSFYNSHPASLNFNQDKTLQNVTVTSSGRSNINTTLLKMEEKYTSGTFRGGAASVLLDVAHDEMASAKQDIYNYVIGKVPALYITYSGTNKKLKSKDVADGPFAAGRDMIIFLNESEMDENLLSTLNIDDIAFIKYMSRYPGAQGLPPALAIYLRKGAELNNRAPQEGDQKVLRLPGYSPLKEFYSPDYSQSNTGSGTDARTTLLWQPYLLTDKHNMKVPVTFYNNDFSKHLRVVLEGINDDGKLIYIERFIE